MRILYIHQYFATRNGKTGTRSYEFAKRLLRKGHQVTMLTSTSALSDVPIPDGKKVHRFTLEGIDVVAVRVPYAQTMSVPRRIMSFLQFMIHSSWVACRETGHDVVFASSTPLTVGVPGILASAVLRVPLVFEVRDLWPEMPIQLGVLRNPILIQILRGFERFIYRYSRHVVVLSPDMGDGVQAAGGAAEKITFIPNCSDLDLFHPGDPIPAVVARFNLGERFVCTHAGSMGANNGLMTVLDAATELQQQGQDDVVILLVGEGATENQLRQVVAERQLRNLVFTGGMPRSDVAPLLQSTDVCLVTSVLAINSPNKLFDALAAGRPVIVNADGWTGRLTEQENIGRYAQPGDGSSLAREILWLRDHPQERAAMARQARKVAETQFDRILLADRLESVLVQAVGGGSPQDEPVPASAETSRQPSTTAPARPASVERVASSVVAPTSVPSREESHDVHSGV